ncbi:MAG: lysophospholipase [Deltaproteobacteria bacterium]|nr:lysophospholipase [Deltaproteobacteria bacterium]
MADVKHEEWQFEGKEGVSLYAQAWTPPEARRAMVVVHGLGEHSGRYQNIVDHFTPRGFAVYGFDQRGFGKSAGTRAFTASFDDFLDDLDSFVDVVRARRPGEKIVVVGHSMGGLIVLRWAAFRAPRVAALVSSGAALVPGASVSRMKIAAARILSRISPKLSMPNEVNPADLSHDQAVVKAYEQDPLVIRKITARLGFEIIRSMGETLSAAGRVQIPILLLHGADDALVDSTGTRKFFETTQAPDKRLHLYPGFLHEIFNENGKEKVFQDMEAWLSGKA